MNPDGWQSHNRYNSAGIDLNRNFPSPLPGASTAVPQPETQAVVDWSLQYRFLLSAGLHSGAQGVVYPWGHPHDYTALGTQFPETALVRQLSLDFTDDNPYLYAVHGSNWYHGTTNGTHWYAIHNEMADWNYRYAGCLETTIEFANSKSPDFTSADQYFFSDDGQRNNRDALIDYLAAALNSVSGRLLDAATDTPVAGKVAIRRPPTDDHDAWLSLPPFAASWHQVGLPRRPLADDFSFGPGTTAWRYDPASSRFRSVSAFAAGAAYWVHAETAVPAQCIPVSTELPLWQNTARWRLATLVEDGTLPAEHHAYVFTNRQFRRLATPATIPAGTAFWLQSPADAPAPDVDPWPLATNLPYPNLSDAAGGTAVTVNTDPNAAGWFHRLLAPDSTPLWCTAAQDPAIYHQPPTAPDNANWSLSASFQPPLRPAAVFVPSGDPILADGLPLSRHLDLPLQPVATSLRVIWQHGTDGDAWQALPLESTNRTVSFQLPTAPTGDYLRYRLELRDQHGATLANLPATDYLELPTP